MSSTLGHLVAQATFEGPDVGWFALSPLIVLVGAALGLLLLGALDADVAARALYAWVTVAAAIAAGALAMANWDDITDGTPSTLVDGALAFDTFAMFVTIAVCVALIGVALITSDHLAAPGSTGRSTTACSSSPAPVASSWAPPTT